MDNLFELIRNEEVIVWAGAGLSMSAGYPSGNQLCEILIDNLSKSEKELINNNLLLPDLTEEIFRIKGNNKNLIIRVLNKVFLDSKQKTTEMHDKIALIPHFKTIITTNYDKLLESSFGDKARLILTSSQIPYFEKNKTEIFKVHGDLTLPESIIITKSDYINFFSDEKENEIYWNVIKERLSTKSVLFLGYNLEDPNISVIFEKITNSLASHRKECFLIAPNLPQHKINHLVKIGIKYIDSTAEDFIDDLISNLKENIISDLEAGKISADSFRSFLANFKLFPELRSDENVYKIKKLHGENGKIEGKMNLSFKPDKDFIKKFNDFMSGKTIGKLEMSDGNLLKGDLWIGGIKLNNFDQTSKIEFQSVPNYDTKVDIRFEDGFEISDVPVKVYCLEEKIEIHIELKNAQITIQLEILEKLETKVNFNYKHKENCRFVNEELELFRLLKNLGSGMLFTIFNNNGKSFSKSSPVLDSLIVHAEFYLLYFQKLKEIENYFNVRFSNINIHSISESTYMDVNFLISVINGESITHIWDGEMKLDLSENTEEIFNGLNKINRERTSVMLCEQHKEEFEIHGQKISLGYKMIEIIKPNMINIESFKKQKTKTIKVKSIEKEIKISYSKNNTL